MRAVDGKAVAGACSRGTAGRIGESRVDSARIQIKTGCSRSWTASGGDLRAKWAASLTMPPVPSLKWETLDTDTFAAQEGNVRIKNGCQDLKMLFLTSKHTIQRFLVGRDTELRQRPRWPYKFQNPHTQTADEIMTANSKGIKKQTWAWGSQNP